MKKISARYSKTPQKSQSISKLYMKLKSRITMYFFLLVILPAIFTTVVLYVHTCSLVEELSYKAAISELSQENKYVGKCLDDLKMAVYSSASMIDSNLGHNPSLTSTKDKGSEILSSIISDSLSRMQKSALSAAYIIDRNGIKASFGPDSAQATITSPESQKWYLNALANSNDVIMLGTVQRFYSEGHNKIVLSIAKSIGNESDPYSQKVLLFDFKFNLISDFLSPSDFTEQSVLSEHKATERFILDHDGNILFCYDMGKLTTKADEVILSAIKTEDKNFFRLNYNGSDYYLTYINYSNPDWTFVDLNPASNVTGHLWLRSSFLTATFIIFAIVLLVYLGIIMSLLKPINDLTAVISDYENYFPGASGHPPLLQMQKNDSVSSNASDVDYLINKISSIKLSQKEAELNSLQNQINPHFLYNTLESIRGAALYHGIHEIATMSKSLSLLFRYSINERVLVSVKEELSHLENYISIQNFRFEDKFQLQYQIPPELMNYKILKLTLQPLIENSIKHGLEMKLGKGTIKIEILSLDSNIKILVSDDGVGIPSKKLEDLNKALVNESRRNTGENVNTRTGIGVMNVNSRIKLYFGEQYGLKFLDVLAGTTLEITLPAVKES